MRTPRPKPNKLHDELDALLDGRPVELTDELAPLVEAADALRVELAAYQLDPDVADRHLERVLEGSATVVKMPVRHQPNGWDVRRRVAAVALAAALVLAPATMASAAALPGQAMYPFKRAIEELRIASVQWSPTREAIERTRVADERLDELEQLVELKLFNQVEPAVNALTDAVLAAEKAVADATQEGAAGSEVADLAGRLGSVQGGVTRAFVMVDDTLSSTQSPLSGSVRNAIEAAVQESREVLEPLGSPSTGTPTPEPKGPESPPVSDPQPNPAQPPPPAPEPSQPTESSQATESSSTTQTTAPEPTTTTEPEATSGSAEGAGGQPAQGGKESNEVAPATTLDSP